MDDFLAIAPEQIQELTQCIIDPEYFVENFCWLQRKAAAGGSKQSIIPFEMGQDETESHYFQRQILRALVNKENVLTLKSRRVGCSWIAAAYAVWMILFHENVNILFISRNGEAAVKLLQKCKFILSNLAYHDSNNIKKATRADFLKGEIGAWNQQRISIVYRNDDGSVSAESEIMSLNNTDDAGRGDDATFIVFDELAFYEHPDDTWASATTTLTHGGHWMSISCVNPDTYIFTENGIEQIKDYVSQDVDPGTFGKVDPFQIFGRYGMKDCEDVYNSGVTPTRIITTEFGYQLECTHIHPILVNREGKIDWVRSRNIQVGDWVPIKKGMMCFGKSCDLTEFRPPQPSNPNLYANGVWMPPDQITESLAYLLGLLVGDGYIDNTHSKNNRVVVTTIDQQIVDWLLDDGAGLKFSVQSDEIHVVANQKQFVQFLQLIDFPINEKAPRKYIPKIIMTSPKVIVRSFLRGLFDADGFSTKRGTVGFVSTSEQLIDQVHMLLLNFGIPASKSYKVSKPTKKVKVESEQWVLEIGLYAREFYKEIGFSLDRKQERYLILESKSRSLKDKIPFAAPLVRGIREKLPQKPRDFDTEVKRRRILSNRILVKNDKKEHRTISYQAATEILERYDEAVNYEPNAQYYNQLQELVDEDYFWVQVIDIDESQSLTYDFHIPDGHSFISNGLVSHNTPNGIGDVFHRMCMDGDLAEIGRKEIDFAYFKIHWTQAGISEDQKRKATIGMTNDKSDQEWELEFLAPGTVAFSPTHLAACYKPLNDYPDIAQALEDYREKALSGDPRHFYASGCDSAVGRVSRKSKEKDFHAWVSITLSNILAFQYTSQEELSSWAGKRIDSIDPNVSYEKVGTTSKLHQEWPGIVNVEENGPGHVVVNNHRVPRDTISDMRVFDTKQKFKQGAVERFILKIETHTFIITDLEVYQQLSYIQKGASGEYGAPPGYNDDLFMACILANEIIEEYGAMMFPWHGNADDIKKVVASEGGYQASVSLTGILPPQLDIDEANLREVDKLQVGFDLQFGAIDANDFELEPIENEYW